MASERPEYYRARAAEERSAAAHAPTPALARVHADLAAMYDRMAKEADSQATERKRALAQQAEAYVEEIA
jgi:hypothetical protein